MQIKKINRFLISRYKPRNNPWYKLLYFESIERLYTYNEVLKHYISNLNIGAIENTGYAFLLPV